MLPYFEVDRKWKCITAIDRETEKKLYQLWLHWDGSVHLAGMFTLTANVTKYYNQMPVELQNLILFMMM